MRASWWVKVHEKKLMDEGRLVDEDRLVGEGG